MESIKFDQYFIRTIFIYHGVFPLSTFSEELDNVARFVEKSPKEIIILDIHEFEVPTKFSQEHHLRVQDLLMKKIGKYMVSRSLADKDSYGPKLRKLWSLKKTIIVAYADSKEVERNKLLWPVINRAWGDKITKQDLKKYIISEGRSERKGNPMKVLMAEMTPNPKYIALNPKGSLGYMADEINRDLTKWIKDHNLSSNLNLVASDYFLGNRLTEFAIGVNSMKKFTMREKGKKKKKN